MDFASRFLGGYGQGRADKQQADAMAKQEKINALLGQGMGDPSQRQALLPQIAALDANSAFQADSAFAGQEDRAMKRRTNLATIYASAPPQARPFLLQQYGKEFAAAGMDPANPNFDAVAQSFAARNPANAPKVLGPGGMLVNADGSVVARNEYQAPRNAQLVPVPDGKGGTVLMEYDTETRTFAEPNYGGAPQQAPQAQPASGPSPEASTVQTVLDTIGQQFGFETTSSIRSPEENAALPGSAPNSQHVSGTARDYSVRGKTPQQVQSLVAALRSSGFEVITRDHGTGPHVHAELPPQRGGAVGGSGGGPRFGYNPGKSDLKPQVVQLSPQEVAQLGLPEGTVAQRGEDGKVNTIFTPDAGSRKAAREASAKLPRVNAALRRVDRLATAIDTIANGFFDGGPADQYVLEKTPEGQEVVQAAASLLPELTALTRVPGVGSQSDLETRLANLQLPSLEFPPEVNRRAIAELRTFMQDLADVYGQSAGSQEQQQAAPESNGWGIQKL